MKTTVLEPFFNKGAGLQVLGLQRLHLGETKLIFWSKGKTAKK